MKARDHCSRQRFNICKWETTVSFNKTAGQFQLCLWQLHHVSLSNIEKCIPWWRSWVCSWSVIRHYEVDDPTICGRCRVKGRIIMVLYPTTCHKVSFESLSALGASSGPAAAIDQPAQQIYYDDITIIFCSEGIKSALTLVLKILFTVSVLLEDLDWESVYIVKVINDAQLKAVLAWFHIIIVAER